MQLFDCHKDILAFMQLANAKKRMMAEWMYIHISSTSSDCSISLEEIEQFVQFYISLNDAYVFKSDAPVKDLLILKKKEKSLALNAFEKAFHENFLDDQLTISCRGLDADSLSTFSQVIEKYISEDDTAARISFQRLRRAGNCFLVLDDDPMVLKQLEGMLANIGTVVTLRDAHSLKEEYCRCAPNIIFLDVHLKDAEGGKILKEIRTQIDPHAHVVMISSDTKKEIVIDIKDGGAKGFIVKPFSPNKLYNEIARAPGIITRSGSL